MNSIKHSEIAPGDIVQPTGGMDGRMTRDDIQRMALDAGFAPKELSRAMTDRLERFISLVAKETTSLCGTGALQADQQPYAWVVPPSNHVFRGRYAEHDAKCEARYCGCTARAVPLYTAPQPVPADPADALDAARYRWLRLAHRKTLFGVAFTESEIDAAIDAEMLEAAKEAA